jgi:hypothetical protein
MNPRIGIEDILQRLVLPVGRAIMELAAVYVERNMWAGGINCGVIS